MDSVGLWEGVMFWEFEVFRWGWCEWCCADLGCAEMRSGSAIAVFSWIIGSLSTGRTRCVEMMRLQV